MKYILNNISFPSDFLKKLENYYIEIIDMMESDLTDTVLFKSKSDVLINDVKNYLKRHITPSADNFIKLLDNSYINTYDHYSPHFGIEKPSKIFLEKTRISGFNDSLHKLTGYIKMTESLINPDKDLNIHTVSDKNDFVLSKLNEVFGDELYSISTIFNLNGIKFREDETIEIAEDLSARGYILKERYGSTDCVKISVKGARYIERKLKIKKDKADKGELDEKIDEILEHLVTLGFGQEAIFNEIDELKELQHTLSKKSWAQLLKGKLVDLTLDKLLTPEAAKSVYEYLTNVDFKLLNY